MLIQELIVGPITVRSGPNVADDKQQGDEAGNVTEFKHWDGYRRNRANAFGAKLKQKKLVASDRLMDRRGIEQAAARFWRGKKKPRADREPARG